MYTAWRWPSGRQIGCRDGHFHGHRFLQAPTFERSSMLQRASHVENSACKADFC